MGESECVYMYVLHPGLLKNPTLTPGIVYVCKYMYT